MHRNKSVSTHQFAMVPRTDIPRSSFRMQKTVKTTFDSGFLVPVFCEEILPGDSFNVKMTGFARMPALTFPIMDNIYLESFFFFVPNRLVWENWERFMGQQDDPSDSISFSIPQSQSPNGGYDVGSLQDHFGLPTVGQIAGTNTFDHSCLPLRAYNLIYNTWFRDENLCLSRSVGQDDGPDTFNVFVMQRRGKRHDYFTSCLPFLQKGTAASVPLGGFAPVIPNGTDPLFVANGGVEEHRLKFTAGNQNALWAAPIPTTETGDAGWGSETGLQADLSAASAFTINLIRQAWQIQVLLERDARGGTRYTEINLAHFGVRSPDARLQRPEYLGGGSTPIAVNPVAQTSATDVTGSTSPLANLSAFATALMQGHGFSQSFTEHGYVIGIVNVRCDLTYQQGVRKHWNRLTRYDYYWPAFAMLGEQAVLNREIFCDGSATDDDVFGYQERWAEYRYNPSEITGQFRSTYAQTLDAWHLSQVFATVPTLNQTFIQENPPIDRVVSLPDEPEFLFDAFFDIKAARPLPLYSVPGSMMRF